MLPFIVNLKPGLPVAGQIVFSVKRAVALGQLAAGAKFPSVRQLSQDLRINPNTAHKVVQELVDEGVLITTPGIGSTVAERRPVDRKERAELLRAQLERLVVEARNLGMSLEDTQASLAALWKRLGGG
ncbi:MAG TPA: GntR family transcriptional regulator [Opitutaceae bacterium]|jgi:GntR family transcriptional regulator